MPEHVRKLSAFVLGGCFVGLLVSQTFLSVGCGRRTVTGQADIKGIYDKVTTGMTVEQVMNLFQPTGPNITRVEADGKISMSWTEKGGGGFVAVFTMEGGKVVDKNWEFVAPPTKGQMAWPVAPSQPPEEEKSKEGLP